MLERKQLAVGCNARAVGWWPVAATGIFFEFLTKVMRGKKKTEKVSERRVHVLVV